MRWEENVSVRKTTWGTAIKKKIIYVTYNRKCCISGVLEHHINRAALSQTRHERKSNSNIYWRLRRANNAETLKCTVLLPVQGNNNFAFLWKDKLKVDRGVPMLELCRQSCTGTLKWEEDFILPEFLDHCCTKCLLYPLQGMASSASKFFPEKINLLVHQCNFSLHPKQGHNQNKNFSIA